MHKIQVTHGLVLRKRGVGESNTQVALLTEELGLLYASARSARKEVSKLRYGLETLTTARYSLLRGRNEWKLVGVESVERLGAEPSRARQQASVARLLLRLVRGEEQSLELYTLALEGLRALGNTSSDEDAEALECILVLQLLAALGYVPQTLDSAWCITNGYTQESIARAREERRTLVRIINESLRVSGL